MLITLSRRRGKLTARQHAAIILAQVKALAHVRRSRELSSSDDNLLWIAALILASAPPGPNSKFGRWPGLDALSLRLVARQMHVGNISAWGDRPRPGGISDTGGHNSPAAPTCPISDDRLDALLRGVERWQAKHGVRLPRGEYIGSVLAVTAAERAEARAWRIVACDESRIDRVARCKAEKAARMREARSSPRGAFLSTHDTSRLSPWQAEGMSRASWYRMPADWRERSVRQVRAQHRIEDINVARTCLKPEPCPETSPPTATSRAAR